MVSTAFSAVLLLSAAVCSAQVVSYFSPEEVSKHQERARLLSSSPKSLKDAYYSLKFLKITGVEEGLPCNCDVLKGMMGTSGDSMSKFYGMGASNLCGCGLSVSPEDIQEGLQRSDLLSIVGSALTAHEMGTFTASSDLLRKLEELSSSDGTFKSSPLEQTSSLENTHLALDMLAAVVASGYEDSEKIAAFFEKTFPLLPTGDAEALSDPRLVASLSKLTEKKLRLVGSRLVAVAEALLSNRHTRDFASLVKVYEGLNVVKTYKATPIYVGLAEKTFFYNRKDTQKLKIDTFDVLGTPIQPNTVEILSVKNVAKDGLLFQGQQLEPDSVLDMSSEDLVPGRYIVQVSISASNRPKPIPFQGYFVVLDTADIADVYFGIADSKQFSSSDLSAVNEQNSVSELSASALSSDTIVVEYAVKSDLSNEKLKKPHQSFVRCTHVQTGTDVYFIAKRSSQPGDARHSYSSVFALGDEIAKFRYLSGLYTVSILVADVTYIAPTEFVIGSVEFAFPEKPVENHHLYAKSLLDASDNALAPLPEISHVMRPADKRASDFMATLFTALTWLPLLVFAGFLVSLHPDIKRLTSLSSLLFAVCILVVVALYVGYWLALEGVSFYDTIKYICFLFPITVMIGRYALSSVTEARMKEKEVKGK